MGENKNTITNALVKPHLKTVKTVAITVVVVLILLGLVGIYFRGYQSAKSKYQNEIERLNKIIEETPDPVAVHTEASTEIDIGVIETQIQEIGELATMEYLYTDAGKFTDPKQVFGINIPFTTKEFIVKWNGIVKAGVKVSNITVQVNEITKTIIIHVPQAEILDHYVDPESFETLDEKNGLFNQIKVDDVKQFEITSKEVMEKRVLESQLLDKAYENAKSIIKNLLNANPTIAKHYEIKFQ